LLGSDQIDIGVGATEELSLRVSAATLARVVFKHPEEDHLMLALERLATLRETEVGQQVTVKAQPFGGAVRLRSLSGLGELIGDFHFDSERSRSERDFRLQIRPSDWQRVKRFCLQHFQDEDETTLESTPDRELAEEFADTLKIRISSAQYWLKRIGPVIENDPTTTGNIYAVGRPTVRIYQVCEVCIVDSSLARAILANSERHSDQHLQALALQDAKSGGKGRANAALALPLELLTKAYLSMPAQRRASIITIEGHYLDGNVPAVLADVLGPSRRHVRC
jgi:hypothetical protein